MLGIASQPLSLAGLVAAAALLCIFYVLAIAIYRIYFHRTSKIPGPTLAKITYFYQAYYDLYPMQGRFMWHLIELHKKYGPVVRIGPDEVHVNDPSFYNEMYTSNSRRRDKSRLHFWMIGSGEFGDMSAFATLEHDHHRVRRSGMGLYFSKRMVQNLEPRIVSKVNLLRERLLQAASKKDAVVDIYHASGGLSLDVITEYSFGDPAGALDRPDMGREWVVMLIKGVQEAHHVARFFPQIVVPMLAIANHLPNYIKPKTVYEFKKFEEFINDKTRGAFERAHARKGGLEQSSTSLDRTVLDEMVHSETMPPAEKELKRLEAEAMILIGAGTETTARVLAHIFFHILAKQEVYSRLLEELRTVIPRPDSSLPPVSTLETLPYLTAVVNEGLRITHAVCGRIMRIAPDENLTHPSGVVIPSGTTFSQSPYIIHTNSDIYPEPFSFLPERMMAPEGAQARLHLSPYGKGTRACAGINLANAELYLTIAALIGSIDMTLFETTEYNVTTVGEYFSGALPRDSKGIRVKVLGMLEK